MAFSPAFVEIRFKLASFCPIIFDFYKMLPFRTKLHRVTVRQMESDELRQSGLVPVRQVTTFMPTVETLHCTFGPFWSRPLPFTDN